MAVLFDAAPRFIPLPVVSRRQTRPRSRLSCGALAVSPRSRADFLLRVLFPSFPDSRADRPRGPVADGHLPQRGGACAGPTRRSGLAALLVCSDRALGGCERSRAARTVLGGASGVGAAPAQSVAARDDLRLPGAVHVVCDRRAGFFRLPIRRHAARRGVRRTVFCPGRLASRLGRCDPAIAREPLPSALGMVSHLLRIRHREDGGPRPGMAEFHRVGSVLPEWPVAHVDRLVRAAFSALVPRSHRRRRARARAGARLAAVLPAALPHRAVLLHRLLSGRYSSHRQLRLSELPQPGAFASSLGRSLPPSPATTGSARASRRGGRRWPPERKPSARKGSSRSNSAASRPRRRLRPHLRACRRRSSGPRAFCSDGFFTIPSRCFWRYSCRRSRCRRLRWSRSSLFASPTSTVCSPS
jgi:hypothetical protein